MICLPRIQFWKPVNCVVATIENRILLLRRFPNSRSRLLKLAGVFSQLKHEVEASDLCKVSESVNQLAICKIQPKLLKSSSEWVRDVMDSKQAFTMEVSEWKGLGVEV